MWWSSELMLTDIGCLVVTVCSERLALSFEVKVLVMSHSRVLTVVVRKR